MQALAPGQSYLWIGSLSDLSWQIELIPLVDRLVVDGSGLGAEEWRELHPRIHQRPHGQTRLVVFASAELLSELVQNMILKVVEEPPSQTVIIAQVYSAETLLPTLRSRLRQIRSSSTASTEETTAVWSTFFSDSVSALEQLHHLDDREKLRAILRSALLELTKLLLGDPTAEPLRRHRAVEQALVRLDHNGNRKLIIDSLVLQIFSGSGNEIGRR